MKGKRLGHRIARALIAAVLVVATFWFAIPHFASYRSVWASMHAMTPIQALLIAAAAVVSMVSSWFAICAVLPSIRLRQAAVVNLGSTAVANSLPAGGAVALGVSWVMLSSWDVGTAEYVLYTLVSGIWNIFARLGLPVLALLLLLTDGRPDRVLLMSAVAGVALLAMMVVGLGLVLRSESLALRVEQGLLCIRTIASRLVRRPPPRDAPDWLRGFRDRAVGLLAARGWRISVTTAASQLTLWLVLLACLRGVGLSQAQVSWQISLAAYAFVRLLTVLPITPGGLGVVELGLVGIMAAGADHQVSAQVTGAVLLYRAVTYLPPIPLGGVAYLLWRYAPGLVHPIPGHQRPQPAMQYTKEAERQRHQGAPVVHCAASAQVSTDVAALDMRPTKSKGHLSVTVLPSTSLPVGTPAAASNGSAAPRRRRRSRPGRPATSPAPAVPQISPVAGPAQIPEIPELDLTFADLGVPDPIVAALAGAGITAPFPIQAAVLPDALAGRDILGRGRTGSGKTLGFAIPLAARLTDGYTSACRPRGLVLVPTRELASQVQAVLVPLAQAMDLTVATIFGGTSQHPQVAALRARADIVVACPGRLADLIEQGHCHLGDVEISVIDEADHMADLGFLPIVSRLLAATPPEGQRMLFSATLDSAVDVLVRRFLANPATHAVDPAAAPTALVHHLLTVTPAERAAVVAVLAGGKKRSLIFTRTKHGAQKLARQLAAAHIPTVDLHGNLTQSVRERNLASFAAGEVRVMVATDIAARGIHVDGIDLVIHADSPTEHKAYLHRSGRTARAGAAGVVVTLQTQGQADDVRALMRRASVAPLAATVRPGSALLRTIAGEPADRIAPVTRLAARPPALVASQATGRGAAAFSAGYRGRRGR
ncbi:MAG: hypothetical protein QOJ73_7351 [Streptosporangiaceae bacterium]|nr:hypothetical protein [Streptosporangiaceae bacterium]